MTTLLVSTLLHEDPGVRTAAASLAFNVSVYVQKPRVEKVRGGRRGDDDDDDDEKSDGEEEWEVEIVSAVVEAVRSERMSEDVGT